MKITKYYDFTAEEFFNYLDDALTRQVQAVRHNKMPVKVAKGMKFTILDHYGNKTNVEITDYQRNKIFAAHYKDSTHVMDLKYTLEDSPEHLKVTLEGDVNNYDSSKHSGLRNLFHEWRNRSKITTELNRAADGVYEYLISKK